MINSRRFDWKTWLVVAATALVLAAAYAPLLAKFFRSLSNRSHYQHFPFVLAAFAWLLWQRYRHGVPKDPAGRRTVGWSDAVLFVVAWVLLALAYYAHSPWLAAVSLVVLAAGWLVRLERSRAIAHVWGIWCILWLVIPLPDHPDQQLIATLQRGSSYLSSVFLDLVHTPHLMAGNVLHLDGQKLFVDEACSGVVSLMSIIACAVIYAVWKNRPWPRIFLLALAGMGWATLMNVGRIAIIAYALAHWGVDWSHGLPHEILGLAMFAITFGALVSTDQLLAWATAPIVPTLAEVHGDAPPFGRLLMRLWDWVLGRPDVGHPPMSLHSAGSTAGGPVFACGAIVVLGFGLLGGVQFIYGDWLFALENARAATDQNAAVLDNAAAIDANLLPTRCGSFVRKGYQCTERERDNVFGRFSQTYEYEDESGHKLLVSCDYPFGGGWHELAICYQGIGWEQTARRVIEAQRAGDPDEWSYVEAHFRGRDGSQAYLVFCQFDEYGNAVAPPTSSFFDYVRQRLLRPVGSLQGKQHFQVQVWTTDLGEVSDEERQTVREILLDCRQRFRQVILGEETTKGSKTTKTGNV